MAKTSKVLLDYVKKCDIVVEVRDARVPFTSANPMMDGLAQKGPITPGKPRIVVLNKADLANPALQSRVLAALHAQGHQALFMSADQRLGKPSKGVSELLRLVDAMPKKSQAFKSVGAVMLVVGIPNVGKSSLINAMRHYNKTSDTGRASVAPTPGHTRQVTAIKVRHKPALYLFDSPGVLMPKIPDVEVGMRLVACTAMKEATVPYLVQAEYLLYQFATIGSTRFVEVLGLSQGFQEDKVEEAMTELAVKLGMRKPGGEPDLEAASRHFVRAFQDGQLGRFTLDYVPQLEAPVNATDEAQPAQSQERRTAINNG